MYGVLPYYLSKTFVELPYQLLIPCLFLFIIYWCVQFRNEAECFFSFMATLLLVVFYGNSLGMMVSSSFKSVREALAIVPVIVLPLMLYSGYVANISKIVVWLRWIQYLSPIRYSLEIFFRYEYREADFIGNSDPLNQYPVSSYEYTLGSTNCFWLMAVIGVAIRVAAFFMLKLQTVNT